jgi:uncharacterized membrane protein YqjE
VIVASFAVTLAVAAVVVLLLAGLVFAGWRRRQSEREMPSRFISTRRRSR